MDKRNCCPEYGFTPKALNKKLKTLTATDTAQQERVARMNRGSINNADLKYLNNALEAETVDDFLKII